MSYARITVSTCGETHSKYLAMFYALQYKVEELQKILKAEKCTKKNGIELAATTGISMGPEERIKP